MATRSYTVQVSVNPTQNIALRLPVHQAPSDIVPYELEKYHSKDVWVARQRAILMKGSRYLKPRFEIIWAIFMLLASFAVPIATYYLVLHALPEKTERDEINGHVVFNDERFWQARAASIGAFLGLMLIGWVPLFVWKAYGKSQVNQMLRKFSAEDAAVAGPNAQVPQWQMKMPGIGSKSLHVIISFPRPPLVTPFHMGAALPPYLVNPPNDPAAMGYYMGPGHALGQPHHAPMNNMSGVPLYDDRDEKVPDYTGPASNLYLPHEKESFEDIKV